MKIIDAPWLAIDIGSDRTHVAFQESDTDVKTVETLENEFDTVFHVSKNNHVITCGRAALEHLESDPGGIVLVEARQLKEDAPILVPDGRTEVRPSRLFTEMLRHIREYCEMHLFGGEPIRSCVLAIPRRNDKFRRAYRKLAVQAGFRQVLFRDALLSAGATWRHVWGEDCRYLMVCNLAASLVSFSLLRSRCGGFERVQSVSSVATFGVDEIDRIILETAYTTSTREPAEMPADRQRLKGLRRECNFDVTEEAFELRLGGRNSRIYTKHFVEAAQILAKKIEEGFRQYQQLCQSMVGEREIPVAMVGGGTNIPAIFNAVEHAAEGKVYWWGGAEEAVALGTALSLLPPQPKENPTDEEAHFYNLFQQAEDGNVESQYYLGKSLELGHGTPVSPEEAFDWLLLAAGNGFNKAKYRLAKLIYKGIGTVHDESESLRLLRESAEEGFHLSQYLLGVHYHEAGSGPPGEALDWLQKAAAKNFPPAISYIESHFGAEALPQITKTELKEGSAESGEHEDHSPASPEKPMPLAGDASTPGEGQATDASDSARKKTAADPRTVAGLLIGTAISITIFLAGALLLNRFRVENPVAEYGSLFLLVCAAGAAILTIPLGLRLRSAGQSSPEAPQVT